MMDVLDRLLELARAEGALSAEGIGAFAAGLRERARVLLDERVGRLEQALAELERERAWRREAMTALEQQVRGLERENAWRRETAEALQAEAQALREARDAAAASHEKLLAHHREALASAAGRFTRAAELPVWKLRACRALLRESAALFAAGTP